MRASSIRTLAKCRLPATNQRHVRVSFTAGPLHPGLQCCHAAASAFRQLSSTCRTAFPAQHLRPSGGSQLLALRPGTLSRILSGIKRAAQTVLKRGRSRDTSASSALGILNDYKKGKSSPYSITERRVPELIPVLGSQPAGDVSHKPGGRLPLLSASPALTLTILNRAATSLFRCLVNRGTMGVNNLPKTVTRQRFEPRPFCA